MRKLKQKHIQDFLQDIPDFKFNQKQKINLEQHLTPPNIASQLLYYIHQNQDITNMSIADIGIGTGMLICGCIYIGAERAYGFQYDEEYLLATKEILQQKVQGSQFQLIHADIRSMKMREQMVDLVVMNPPFGTKQAGIDMKFVEFAMGICSGNIYSMHKSSTRKFITKFCEERGYVMEVLMEVKFPLKKRFVGYHKKDVGVAEVDIIVFRPTKQLREKRKSKRKQNRDQVGNRQIQREKQEIQSEKIKAEQKKLQNQAPKIEKQLLNTQPIQNSQKQPNNAQQA